MEVDPMKSIQDLYKEIGLDRNKPREWSNEARLELLSIDLTKRQKIINFTFERVNYDDINIKSIGFKKIKITDLVGINRYDDVENWLELLFKLHKKRNFDTYNGREQFEKYANSLSNENDDCPHVLEVDNKYYIHSNGKHRLTIAKCLELDEFPVFVSKLKDA
ncbi:hypothetical protein [Plesiomonas shigelloides]|uniref:hypothetical protein n=1 Tax=Plesiomonas shigelloides TaxID=703 RepID=UPI00057B5020|nr:hypothetical protein [Plesiomonas shigelloides]